jgi:hypothetical protein
MALTTGSTCLQPTPREHPDASETSPQRVPAGGSGTAIATRGMPEPEVGYYIAPGTGGHGRARADGLLAVVHAYACRVGVFGYDATRRDKFLIMVAARPVLDALDLLLPSIAVQMETAARAAARTYGDPAWPALLKVPAGRQGGDLKVTYFRSYLRGFGQGAAQAVGEIRAQVLRAEGDELLRVLAEQDIRAAVTYGREFPDTSRLRQERAGHAVGFLEGRDAGRAADLGDGYLARHDLLFAML